MPNTLSYFEDHDHFVTNFNPVVDNFSRHLQIAEEMGYRAWVTEEAKGGRKGMKGFYVVRPEGGDLCEFWQRVREETGRGR